MRIKAALVLMLLLTGLTACQSAFRMTKNVDYQKEGFVLDPYKFKGKIFVLAGYLSKTWYQEITAQAKWDKKLMKDLSGHIKRHGAYAHVSASVSGLCADYTTTGLKNKRLWTAVSMSDIGIDKMVAAAAGTKNGIDSDKYAKAVDHVFKKVMKTGDLLLLVNYSDYVLHFQEGKREYSYSISYKAMLMGKIAGNKSEKLISVSGQGAGTQPISEDYAGTLAGYINGNTWNHPLRDAVFNSARMINQAVTGNQL